jgi:uncharacterized protein (TIGR03067 family)
MSETGRSFWSQHFGNILIAAIGALGAIVAAIVPIYLNRTTEPLPQPALKSEAEKAPESDKAKETRPQVLVDLERTQGTWDTVSLEFPPAVQARMRSRAGRPGGSDFDPTTKAVWIFHGNDLNTRVIRGDGIDGPAFQGTFTLRQDRRGTARLFDFKGKGGRGNQDWAGIYEFDGEFLRICYQVHRESDESGPGRATSFNTDVDHGGGFYQKLKKRP